MWLGSRGQFMLIDNVVKGTAEVRLPGENIGALAWKLFVFGYRFSAAPSWYYSS